MCNPGKVHSLNISTIDSQAWSIFKAGSSNAKILKTFEENIKAATHTINCNLNNTADYIRDEISHIIVDEAQDIVGERIEFIQTIFSKLSPNCGITIFSDMAQSIYGFITNGGNETLVTHLENNKDILFKKITLETIYRTNSEKLIPIFSQIRKKILRGISTAQEYSRIVNEIISYSCKTTLKNVIPGKIRDSWFILYRTRGEALKNSTDFADPHRLRISQMPVCIKPWIGICFHDYLDNFINYQDFEEIWNDRVVNSPYLDDNINDSWKNLRRHAREGDDLVSMSKLRKILIHPQPPVVFCNKELGSSGPVFGTIHASKGREADFVWLTIPDEPWYEDTVEEESRVLFVGASRPKKELFISYSEGDYHLKIPGTNRRFWKNIETYQEARVEVGRDGDIDAEGIAGRNYFSNPQEVHNTQKWLTNINIQKLKAHLSLIHQGLTVNGSGYHYVLYIDKKPEPVAILSNYGLYPNLKTLGYKLPHPRRAVNLPPKYIAGIRLYGVRTIVVPTDMCQKLHSPWSDTGILLAPVFAGYPICNYRLLWR